MGKPATLLEGLCGHAVSLGARSIRVEYKDGREWVFADRAGTGIGIANYKSSSVDGKELRGNLYATAKRPVRSVIGGQVYILKVTVFESFGEDGFAVSIELAPKLDPSIAPSFTAKQGQYLAFIYNYTKIHDQPPAEADLERYFRVSTPAIHEMIKNPGAQRPDRTNSWAGAIHSPPCTTEEPAAIGIGFTDSCSKHAILRHHLSDRVRDTPPAVRCSSRRDVKNSFSVRFKRYSDSSLKKKTRRGFRGYPIATIAFYGPDDTRASKAAVAIVNAEGAEPSALHAGSPRRATSGQIRLLQARSSSLCGIIVPSRSSRPIES
jgi:hypothetical protein